MFLFGNHVKQRLHFWGRICPSHPIPFFLAVLAEFHQAAQAAATPPRSTGDDGGKSWICLDPWPWLRNRLIMIDWRYLPYNHGLYKAQWFDEHHDFVSSRIMWTMSSLGGTWSNSCARWFWRMIGLNMSMQSFAHTQVYIPQLWCVFGDFVGSRM